MACYHPLCAWSPLKFRNENGKRVVLFSMPPLDKLHLYEELRVPCGQCVGCRLDYSRDWATRIMLEAREYEDNYFVTLTYAPEHLPLKAVVNTETGEYIEGATLVPDHVKKFMKDLRRHWEYHYHHKGIRFYLCGEYGELSGRPHYHICVFNLPLPEGALLPFFLNEMHQQVYLCPEIQAIWKRGNVSVGSLTWDSAAYVARYMLKKVKGSMALQEYAMQAKESEFSRMSRRPGIGLAYYEKNKGKIYDVDEIVLADARVVRPPKYYDRLFDLDSPEAMAAIKEKRKESALAAQAVAAQKTTLSYDEQLAVKERNHQGRIKKLLRNLE